MFYIFQGSVTLIGFLNIKPVLSTSRKLIILFNMLASQNLSELEYFKNQNKFMTFFYNLIHDLLISFIL